MNATDSAALKRWFAAGVRLASVSVTANATTNNAHTAYTPISTGSIKQASVRLAPKRKRKRKRMQGNAKYSTSAFSPGIAASGSRRRCAAMKPSSTSAKKGRVIETIAAKAGMRVRDGSRASIASRAPCLARARPRS